MKNIKQSWYTGRLLWINLIFFTLQLVSTNIYAQNSNTLIDSIQARINRQLETYPQEKIYVHNDKPLYVTGENIWFRIHLVNALSHRHNTTSLYVYGELIDPIGNVVDSVKIIRRNGIYTGHFKIDEELADAVYTMSFYTKYMKNLGEDYFFKRNIIVGGGLSNLCHIEPTFQYENDKIEINLNFIETQSNKTFVPEELRIRNKKGQLQEYHTDPNGLLSLDYPSSKDNPLTHIYLEYKFDKKIRKQYIQVPSISQDYDIQILPEGGNLLKDITSRVAFKAVDSNGLGEDVTLAVINEKGDTILTSKSTHKGMGLFSFTPTDTSKYTVHCLNSDNILKKIDLSAMIENGHGLSLYSANGYISATINSTNSQISDSLFLLVHSKGEVFYINTIDKTSVVFRNKEFPSGIISFQLLDSNMNPISERLIYNKNELAEPNINIETDQLHYKPRHLVKTKIVLSDKSNIMLTGNASVSIIDNKDVKVDSTQNILSSLFLTSELKGTIEEPSYYMQENHRSESLLDLLMLTHGWRRYNMKNILRGEIAKPSIGMEYTNILTGNVKSGILLNRKANNIDITVLTLNPYSFKTVETDENGYFAIGGYDLPDSTIYSINAVTKQGGERLELTINQDNFVKYRKPLTHNYKWKQPIVSEDLDNYFSKANLKYTYENGQRIIHLKDVEVFGKKKGKSLMTSAYSKIYTSKDLSETKTSDIGVMLRHLGIFVEYGEGGPTGNLYINRGAKRSPYPHIPALIIVDNIENPYFMTSGFLVEDIDNIEVAEMTTASALFGPRASNGAIMITTKKGDSAPKYKPNQSQFIPLGYQNEMKFYSPKYTTIQDIESTIPDLRTTIHWEPNIEFKDGEAEIQFYTSDATTEYSIVVEGITDNGIPFYNVDKISVE